MKRIVVIACLLAGSPVLLLAGEADGQMSSGQIKKQLELIEQQVEEQQSELAQQHDRAKLLEQRVECNWALLSGYERCEDAYERSDSEFVKCIASVKEAFKQCESAISTNRLLR